MTGRLGILAGLAAAGLGLVSAGCGGGSAGGRGIPFGRDAAHQDTNLRVYLDGHEATRSTPEKGLSGYASFKVAAPITTSPVFQYEAVDAESFGAIQRTSMQIHRKDEGDFPDQADYVIVPDEGRRFAPDTAYDLGALGEDFTILDRQGRAVGELELEPGLEYLLVFAAQGDNRDNVQVLFKTAEVRRRQSDPR